MLVVLGNPKEDYRTLNVDQYGKDFYVNIGRNISYAEHVGAVSRNSIPNIFHENFAEDILAEAGRLYTVKMLEDERYHDKDDPDYQTVFAFMKTLPWKQETAFLFRKH